MRKQKQSILLNWARPFTGNRFASSAFDTSQRAMVAVEVEKVYTEEAKTRMLAGKAIADPIANLRQGQKGKARDKAAEMLNVYNAVSEGEPNWSSLDYLNAESKCREWFMIRFRMVCPMGNP